MIFPCHSIRTPVEVYSPHKPMRTLHCWWEWCICTAVTTERTGLGWFWMWVFKAPSFQSGKLWENVVAISMIFISISFVRCKLVLQSTIFTFFFHTHTPPHPTLLWFLELFLYYQVSNSAFISVLAIYLSIIATIAIFQQTILLKYPVWKLRPTA